MLETVGQQHKLHLRAIIIATGARVVGAEAFATVTGFQACSNAGLITCYPTDHINILADLTGKTIAVIGGGANAHFTAKDAALAGAQTYLIIRSQPKARPLLRKEVDGLIGQGRIIECRETHATCFHQDNNRIALTLHNNETLTVDRVFVRLGFAANSECLAVFPVFNEIYKEGGYIKTDAAKRTNIPWVYAIGDVANAEHQSVANAIAEGAIAAQDLSERI
jgi:thioredoxin reductase